MFQARPRRRRSGLNRLGRSFRRHPPWLGSMAADISERLSCHRRVSDQRVPFASSVEFDQINHDQVIIGHLSDSRAVAVDVRLRLGRVADAQLGTPIEKGHPIGGQTQKVVEQPIFAADFVRFTKVFSLKRQCRDAGYVQLKIPSPGMEPMIILLRRRKKSRGA
jgi:hypothetical protein